VHFERLVIEAGDATLALDLHRRLTVVAGAGAAERAGLITELIAALGRGRPGVHAEMTNDEGDRLAVFRPPGQRHRVVDVERALDVSHRYTDASGRVNLLARSPIGAREARRLVRLDEADLTMPAQEDELVASLGQVDQSRLWDVAHKVLDRRSDLEEITERTGGSFDDAEVIAEIERRHRRVEAVESDFERIRGVTFVTASAAALAIVPAAAFGTALLALTLAGLALVATAVSVQYWRQLSHASALEREVLAEAGATSYLAFQIQRVNGLVVSDSQRRQLVRADEALRASLAEWRLLAGDVGVEWALEHREAIGDANRRLRAAAGIRSAMVLHLRPEEATAAALSHVLVERLETLRRAGPDGESVPLLLDDPLRNVRPDAKPILLEQLLRASSDQQVVYLTEDADVITWARLEALTGQLAVVEPVAPGHDRPGVEHDHAAGV
jgi:hypothetical protein